MSISVDRRPGRRAAPTAAVAVALALALAAPTAAPVSATTSLGTTAASIAPKVRASAWFPVTTLVALRTAWNVKSLGAIAVTGRPMSCRAVSLVRRGSRPATGVRVRCVAPFGTRTAFPLRVAVKKVRGAIKTVTVRFRLAVAPTFTSAAKLLAAAPLQVPMLGSRATVGIVSFLVPAGWHRTDLTGATELSVTDTHGNVCNVFVLSPVTPDLSSVAALNQQLLSITSALVSGIPLFNDTGGPDVFHHRRQGATGMGFPFVQLLLQTQGAATLYPYEVVFGGNLAVPVVPIGACGDISPFSVALAMIFHSLAVAGSSPNPTIYRKQVRGWWGSSNGSIGVADIQAANGHYVSASSVSVVVKIGGWLYDAYASFAGQGTYSVYGPYLARFPTASSPKASSVLLRIYQDVIGSTVVWRKCEIERGVQGPFELCMGKSG